MKTRNLILGLIGVVIIAVALAPSKTEYEKEIDYYKTQGCSIMVIDPIDFYNTIPLEIKTLEVTVTRTVLREKVSETATELGIKAVFTDEESLWTMWWPTSRADLVYICVWTP